MKVKRLTKIEVNVWTFSIAWDKSTYSSQISYVDKRITIGCASEDEAVIFSNLNHELTEMCAIEMHIRLSRPDCESDFIFVYDHRQFDTLNSMASGLLSKFL